MSRISRLVLVLLLLSPAGFAVGAAPPAEVMAGRMLAALGGREAWAALTSLVNDSQQNRGGEPYAYGAHAWVPPGPG